jgi:hypothetical protein
VTPGEGNRDRGHRATKLRVFFSVDLVGGTAYKNRGVIDDLASPASWPNRFEQFFKDFIKSFKNGVAAARVGTAAGIMPPPQLWKINGDELLFTDLVYEDPGQRVSALESSLRTFVRLVHETDERFIPEGLGVRACVWTAGFPLRNKPVKIVQGGIELMADDVGRSDPETGPTTARLGTITDYIGRDMDIGFRLAALSQPGRIACSLDLAHYALDLPDDGGLAVWAVGWAVLKGILGGQPYPLLWLEEQGRRRARHPWDESSNAFASPEVREYLREGAESLTRATFNDLANRVRALSAGQLIVPYASLAEMPESHARLYMPNTQGVATRELMAEATTEIQNDLFAVSPSHAEPITLDDLNQLLLWLQDSPERVPELRSILAEIARHESYAAWIEERQFAGDLFQLHPSLAFASRKKRWLLESLLLVKNDALRVKINSCDDQVFLTDGLWIDPSIRAFPFSDESDLVMRACQESGWMDWATCVIDPATGCGHNLLRYPSTECRRYGFDRNSRALAYAGINAALNGIDHVTLADSDIRNGLQPVFAQGRSERVLVLANMPFALVPNPSAIARSAYGGRHGYELTLALFDAIDALASQLDGRSELRCVVLTYTLGCQATDTWVVPEHAMGRFGRDRTSWRIWEDEKLWRVNGKKEQANPMPLSLLKLKADCRFYVRGAVSREALALEYEKLATDLTQKGYDHLAYGVVTARHPLRYGRDRSARYEPFTGTRLSPSESARVSEGSAHS